MVYVSAQVIKAKKKKERNWTYLKIYVNIFKILIFIHIVADYIIYTEKTFVLIGEKKLPNRSPVLSDVWILLCIHIQYVFFLSVKHTGQ